MPDNFIIESRKEMKECDKIAEIPDVPPVPSVTHQWSIREIVDALLSPYEDYLPSCLPEGVTIKSSIAAKLNAHPDFPKYAVVEARINKFDGTTYYLLWHKLVWERQYRNKLVKDAGWKITEVKATHANKRYEQIIRRVGKYFKNLNTEKKVVDTVNFWLDCYADDPDNIGSLEQMYLKKFGYFDVDPEQTQEIAELETHFRLQQKKFKDVFSETNPFYE